MQGTAPWILGGLVSLFAVGGLFLAAGAADPGMELFGLALFGFGVLFVFWLIKTGFDAAAERRRARDGAEAEQEA